MLTALSPADLFLGPRPGKKSVDHLAGLSLTHCCTLLSEREDIAPIKKICGRLECQWLWMPMEGGHMDTLRSVDLAAYVRQLEAALDGVDTPRVYLHCSAGIHRTGFFAYALLRCMGLTSADAVETLAELRQVTADQVGADRLALADEMLLESGLLS